MTDARFRNDAEVTRLSDFRRDAVLLAKSFDRLGLSGKATRCFNCGTQLQFTSSLADLHIDADYKLSEANFCRERLCPMCAKRRSLKIFGQVSQVVECIDTEKYDFLFLTLTVPNVSAKGLADKISQMQKAFNKLIHYVRFRRAVVGYFRSLEVTYNHCKRSKSFDTFHPHYHIILVVRKDYFTSAEYIKRNEFLYMWQRAMNDYSITQVDVRKVRSEQSRGVVSISKAVAEVAKYTVKSSDYIFKNNAVLTDKIVSVLSDALKGRRLVSFGGIFADIRDQLGLDDPEDGDLIHVNPDEEENSRANLYLVRRWRWNNDDYDLCDECVETAVELKQRQERRKQAWLHWIHTVRKKRCAA